MIFGREQSRRFLLLGILTIILTKISFISTSVVKIEYFQQASSTIEKSGLEAEMAFFTQFFNFVDEKNEFGLSMLNFLQKYLDMRTGKEAYTSRHGKNGDGADHCKRYLSDDVLQSSGIQYYDSLAKISEEDSTVIFKYYRREESQITALRCPVIVNNEFSKLYFVKCNNYHNPAERSYFVLASELGEGSSDLNILMFKIDRKEIVEPVLKPFQASLDTIVEEEDSFTEEEPLWTSVAYKYTGKGTTPGEGQSTSTKSLRCNDFLKILKMPQKDTNAADNGIVLFGKDAERVFVTSVSYLFINLGIDNRYTDKFIQLIQNTMSDNKILLVNRITNYNHPPTRSRICQNYVEKNAALKLRKIIPPPNLMDLAEEIKVVTKPIIFPRTKLPQVNYKISKLMCPALFGDDRTRGVIYLQIVIRPGGISSSTVFSFLDSEKKPGAVFPVTLSTMRTATIQLSLGTYNQYIPPIGENIAPTTEESEAEISTKT